MLNDQQRQLVIDHQKEVRFIALELIRRLPSHVMFNDLISAGNYGLVKAALTFDPTQGTPFQGHANRRIRGAMLDELRSNMHMGRGSNTNRKLVRNAIDKFYSEQQRQPTTEELADLLGISLKKINKALVDMGNVNAWSLDLHRDVTSFEPIEPKPNPEDLLVRRELFGYLHQAIDALPENLRDVVIDIFFLARPIAEIAPKLGVTESRVSQLKNEAVACLRLALSEDRNEISDMPACVRRRRARLIALMHNDSGQAGVRERLSFTDTLTGLPHAA